MTHKPSQYTAGCACDGCRTRRADSRRYYRENKVRYGRRMESLRVEGRALIDAAKDQPCVDCGVNYGPDIMELDHVRGKKLSTVSTMRASHTVLKREIAKCEVRCPTCHRIRHVMERNGTVRLSSA